MKQLKDKIQASQLRLAQTKLDTPIARPHRATRRQASEWVEEEVRSPIATVVECPRVVVVKTEEESFTLVRRVSSRKSRDSKMHESSSTTLQQDQEHTNELCKEESDCDLDSTSIDDGGDDNEETLQQPGPSAATHSSTGPIKSRRERRIEDHPYDEMMHQMGLLRCHLCPQSFQKYGELTRHCGAAHSAKPSITCCQRIFPKVQLSDHMRYHLDKAAFLCQLCEKAFLSGHLLSRHEASKHQLGDSQYKCPVCEHKFRAPNLLAIHMTKHKESSERPKFKCQHCEKGMYEQKY